MPSAVVFAYHNVGVRCLSVLLAQGIHVPLVVTHKDDSNEAIWFDSVANLAKLHHIPVITPSNPNTPDLVSRLQSLKPDFIFSFYYRCILNAEILNSASRGRYNMHGSLLPKYRGRVPVNWAIIYGETQAGATLHEMELKPDAGAIVGQMPVPILPDDLASEVFSKVLVAAEIVMNETLPRIVDGSVVRYPMDLKKGSYFGGRKPRDGVIEWKSMGARKIHNLVRAVSRPYPGAFSETSKGRMVVWRTMVVSDGKDGEPGEPGLWREGDKVFATACDGGVLRIVDAEVEGKKLDLEKLPALK